MTNSGIRASIRRRVRLRQPVRLRIKQQRQYKQCRSVAEKPATAIQARKKILKVEVLQVLLAVYHVTNA
ncbi:hypothetical protein MTR_3g074810 [Medicago truncatula]|uniref:Uncharacterized protein n=1 Tax=Medicago truncatula TaxID=3880 RepID=A0A072V9V3_MEDTR|nr:hypothetical protein MTR_3g074810 [Medicago truncatula]